MSSLLTFIMRPMVPQCGLAFFLAASMRSLRPSSSPVSLGPRSALPPLKATRSKPIRLYSDRRSTGGTSAAASKSVGTWYRRALADGPLKVGRRLYVDQLYADIGELVVIAAVVRLLQNDFVLDTGRVG